MRFSIRQLVLVIVSVVATFGFSGCQYAYFTGHTRYVPPYYEVTLMDFRGNVSSSWIAEGSVRWTQNGYKFRAVQHNTTHPPQEFHYPFGRPVVVFSANIVITKVGAPAWLTTLDSR